MKRVLILGSGGVGAITAVALESSGKAEVTLIVRGDYDTVTTSGYQINSIDYGNIKNWKPSHVVKTIEEASKAGPYDYVVVCTKFIPELQKTEELIKPVVQKGTSIVLVQNGIGNEEPVMKAFPDAYVMGAVSLIGSINYNAEIKHTGPDSIVVGTYDKRPEAIAAAKEYTEIYDSSKSTAEYTDDLAKRRWQKLMYNATYNTVAALTGLDTGRMFFSGIDQSIIVPAMAELRLIAETELNEKLDDGIEEFLLNCDANEYYDPSMLVDVKKGQLMELEAILGNPLRSAVKNNVEAPLLKTIYRLLHGKQLAMLEKRGVITLPEPGFDVATAKPLFAPEPWAAK